MRISLLLTVFFCLSHAHGQRSQEKPASSQNEVDAPIAGAYYTGIYPNLFAEQGHTPAQVRAKIAAAYAQLFHGDPATERLYFPSGKNEHGGLAYILDAGDHDVRTEGMSYGMMIALQLGHKQEFDALWNWARTYMYEGDPASPSFGYYAWSCRPDGTHKSDTPAPDGEEYFAMALYFAAGRWSGGEGPYDYRARADELLHTMLHRKPTHGMTPFGEKEVGPEFDATTYLVSFLAEPAGRDFTDPSYVLPGFYELWSRWGPAEDRAFWAAAARAGRDLLAKAANIHTGLTPDYANFDGTPHSTAFVESGIFGHDAWRSASNWSWDWSWFQQDPREPALSDRIQGFFASQAPRYVQSYSLEGKPLSPYPSPGLIATNAVTSLAASAGPRNRDAVEALWNEPVPAGQWRYYDGMLYLLSLLHVSGEFRIWKPLS